MKQITNKEYKEYTQYKLDKIHGKILTLDGIRLICEANNYNAEQIGEYMLELLVKCREKNEV